MNKNTEIIKHWLIDLFAVETDELVDLFDHATDSAALAMALRSYANARIVTQPQGVKRDLMQAALSDVDWDVLESIMFGYYLNDKIYTATGDHTNTLPPLVWEKDGPDYLATPLGTHLAVRLHFMDTPFDLPWQHKRWFVTIQENSEAMSATLYRSTPVRTLEMAQMLANSWLRANLYNMPNSSRLQARILKTEMRIFYTPVENTPYGTRFEVRSEVYNKGTFSLRPTEDGNYEITEVASMGTVIGAWVSPSLATATHIIARQMVMTDQVNYYLAPIEKEDLPVLAKSSLNFGRHITTYKGVSFTVLYQSRGALTCDGRYVVSSRDHQFTVPAEKPLALYRVQVCIMKAVNGEMGAVSHYAKNREKNSDAYSRSV